MIKPVQYIFLIFIFCCTTASAESVVPDISDDNIHINADRMGQNLSDGLYTAEGNVVVLQHGLNLTADKIDYTPETHILQAIGSVVLSKESTVLKGEKLTLNMDTGIAEMDRTLLTIPGSSMAITSEKLVRINESEFTATSTELTTCDMPDPSWKFGADSLKANLSGYATGRNVIFYVKNIPVLYIPWIAFPIVMEKKSGLLFPQFGYSKKRGAEVDLPLYWVISPSQDIQFDLDIMSRRGVGTGVDYRYIRTRQSGGGITPYFIYDQVEDRWRWQLTQKHKEIFSNDANLRIDVNAVGDRTFFNDFGEKSGDYNRQSINTTINTLKTWQNYALTSFFQYSEDLYATNNRTTVQKLPSIGVAGVRQAIFSLPLYFDIDGSLDNLYRETAAIGQRLHLYPRVTLLPFASSFLKTTLFAGTHIRGYATDNRNSDSRINSTTGDLLPEAGARFSTSLTRVYDTDILTLKKIRHEIIPEISYGFAPAKDQQQLPLYDYTDRFIHKNMISLSITNLISGKFVSDGTTEYRDISQVKLSADYLMNGERRDLLTLVEEQRQWSDFMLESDTWLTRGLRVTFDSRYNLHDNQLSTAVAGAELDDKKGNSIGIGYQMSRNEVEYFEGRLATKRIRPLNLYYTARYSFDRGDFLESVYAAEYRHKCWSVNIAMHQRPAGNQSFTVNFNLAGLSEK